MAKVQLQPKDRIIVALDVDSTKTARRLVHTLEPHVGAFKVGLEFLTTVLAQVVNPNNTKWETEGNLVEIREVFHLLNGKIMWDGKFSDIPNTMKGAASALQSVSPLFFTIHASAGRKSIAEAVANRGNSIVLGVTVLTSIDDEECFQIYSEDAEAMVVFFAQMLLDEGAQGIVCSPKELALLTDTRFESLVKVIPGIRPAWAATGDQARVTTPAEAIRNGADYLVIGRPITQPPAEIGDPVTAAQRIAEEIASVS